MGNRENHVLNVADLRWRNTGQRYSLWAEHSGEPVMEGLFVEQDIRPGLALHGTEVVFRQGMAGVGKMLPGLKLIVMLKGHVSVRFDQDFVQLGGARSNCVLLGANAEEPFERIVRQPGCHRQVVLTASHEWLAEAGMVELAEWAQLEALKGRPVSSRSGEASSRVLALASILLMPEADASPIARLQRESRALDLLLAAIQPVGRCETQHLEPRARQRVAHLLELLHGNLDHAWTLARLAQEMGSNPTTLQQHFRTATGCSIAGYLRRQRLQRAYEQLSQGRAVTEVAFDAGYSSPANFATAFKRQFGFSPREARFC